MKTGNIQINLIDKTEQQVIPKDGILFALGKTLAGRINDPKEVISSWPQFKELYGGLSPDSLFPLHCKAMLEAGVKLRVCRVAHYTDIEDASSITATVNTTNNVKYLVFDGSLVASNSIALSVNSSAITPVGYATSHKATVQALADAIQAKLGSVGTAGCKGVVYVMDPDAEVKFSNIVSAHKVSLGLANSLTLQKIIKIVPINDEAISITLISITGGATQPTLTYVNSTKLDIYSYGKEKLFTVETKQAGVVFDSATVEFFNDTTLSNSIKVKFTGVIGDVTISETQAISFIPYLPYDGSTGYPLVQANAAGYWAALNAAFQHIKFVPTSATDGSLATKFSFPPIPQFGTFQLTGANVGGALVAADYLGSELSNTGLHAFDSYADSYAIFAPEYPDDTNDTIKTMAEGIIAYADSRKDIRGYVHMPNDLVSEQAIIDFKESIVGHNSQYITFIYGGLKLKDTISGVTYETNPVSAVLANMVAIHKAYGPWRSFAGPTYGVLPFGVGVINNLGGAAMSNKRNNLANYGINCVVARGTTLMLWDDYTGDPDLTQMQFSSIVNLVIYLQKILGPNSEKYLSEPLSLDLFTTIHLDNKPLLESLVAKRALFSFTWNGDQGAASLDDLVINTKDNIALGKYRVQVGLKTVSPLKEFVIDLVLEKL